MTRNDMQLMIRKFHYTRSIPSGKSHYFHKDSAIVVLSIPANHNISRFLGCQRVWELSRLWAPDDHAPNLLTEAISYATRSFRQLEPDVDALVSYADPNNGHEGFVYKAASWVFLGQCEESRVYIAPDGSMTPRRAFHSGSKALKKAEIEALGYTETKLPGKLRFARGLTRKSRREISSRAD